MQPLSSTFVDDAEFRGQPDAPTHDFYGAHIGTVLRLPLYGFSHVC